MCAKDIGPTNLETLAFRAETTGTEVEYRTLAPATLPNGPLPLILHLHGAMSSSASLDAARSTYEGAWASGQLPPAVIACASTPTQGGFYIDYPEGPRWQSLVVDELPRRLASRYRLAPKAALMGFSMGGYGGLSAAFRHPERFLAVAALCPVVFPAETADAVPPRNRPSVLNDLNEAMGGDAAAYADNCVHSLARKNAAAIRAENLQIFIDCGQKDEFHLHDGAAYLHQLLEGLSISHTFRSVPDAGHADAHAPARQEAAIGFLGEVLWQAVRSGSME